MRRAEDGHATGSRSLGACAGCIALLGLGAYAAVALTAGARHGAACAGKDPLVATWRRAHEATRKYRTIHVAARARDHMAVAAFLLTQGDPNALDATNQTPLHVAAYYGCDDIAAMLLAAGADLKARGNGGQTPLHNAAMARFGCWGISRAAAAGKLRVASMLIQRGADVNVKDNQDWTPLHVAASEGNSIALELCKLLALSGADVDAMDKRGDSPLAVAKRNGCPETARLLASYGGH